ncbi:MAG TPA: PAS domain S-box protein, partial [Vicinamibacterales bacterium]
MRVLVVESDPATRELLTTCARERRHDVREYPDSASVWPALSGGPESASFDLAIIGVGAPGLDGIAFCRQFRRHPAGRHAVVLVAADDAAGSVEAALEAGAHDYVLRPIDRRHLDIRLAIAEGRSLANATSRYSREALRESEHRFEAFMNNSPTLAFIRDADGRYVYVNRRYLEAFGISEADRIGRTVREVLPPDTADAVLRLDDDVLRTGQARESMLRTTGPDGFRDWLTYAFPLTDSDGRPTLVGGIAIDITDRVKAEAALRASEERLRVVFEAMQEGLWERDLASGAVTWSDRVFEILRVDRAAGPLDFDAYLALVHPDDRVAVQDALERHLSGGRPYGIQYRMRRGDGTWAHVESMGQAIRDDHGRPIRMVGSIADVTARVEATEGLRRQKARAEALLQIGSHVSGQRDLQAVLDAICEQTRRALGVTAAVVFVHDTPTGMLRLASTAGDPPDLRERIVSTPVEEHLKIGPLDTTVIAIPDLGLAGDHRNFREAAAAGFRSAAIARMLHDGELMGVVAIGEREPRELSDDDLALLQGVADQGAVAIRSARLLEQQRRAEEQMRNAQKLESLGVLAGGIAHDFNNLLVGVLGNAGLALLELPEDSPARQAIRDIEISAQRAAELTRQMLAYSGRGTFQVEPVDLSALVEEMSQLLRRVISKNAQLTLRLDRTIPPVIADATQLRQVVMNLITNASDALEGRPGTIRVETGVVHADRRMLASTYLNEELPEGRYVWLEVSDTGVGMDAGTA